MKKTKNIKPKTPPVMGVSVVAKKDPTIVAIGDIHGRDIWKQIVENESKKSTIVFIGDYFDSFHIPMEVQIENFKEIVAYKRANKDRVVLLIGNHEIHYISDSERYSGYNDYYAPLIRRLIKKALNEGLLQMAFEMGPFLFTHAGVTKTWAETYGVSMADSINLLFKEQPKAFNYYRSDSSGYGDDANQPPTWVRPNFLCLDPLDGYTQIVGHTARGSIESRKDVTFIDVFDNCREYLVIKDRVQIVREIK